MSVTFSLLGKIIFKIYCSEKVMPIIGSSATVKGCMQVKAGDGGTGWPPSMFLKS